MENVLMYLITTQLPNIQLILALYNALSYVCVIKQNVLKTHRGGGRCITVGMDGQALDGQFSYISVLRVLRAGNAFSKLYLELFIVRKLVFNGLIA